MFNKNLMSIIVAAGAGAFVYAQFGRRMGSGNSKRLWILIAAVFILVYLVVFSSLHWLI